MHLEALGPEDRQGVSNYMIRCAYIDSIWREFEGLCLSPKLAYWILSKVMNFSAYLPVFFVWLANGSTSKSIQLIFTWIIVVVVFNVVVVAPYEVFVVGEHNVVYVWRVLLSHRCSPSQQHTLIPKTTKKTLDNQSKIKNNWIFLEFLEIYCRLHKTSCPKVSIAVAFY